MLVSRWGNTYRKVNRTVARNLFSKGETILLLPNKVAFNNCWMLPSAVNYNNELNFDSAVNAYQYYNCNSELGNSVAYYVLKEGV